MRIWTASIIDPVPGVLITALGKTTQSTQYRETTRREKRLTLVMWLTFIILYKAVLTFESELLKSDHLIENSGAEQYFPVVLFIILYKVVQTFESVDEILKCDHLDESC